MTFSSGLTVADRGRVVAKEVVEVEVSERRRVLDFGGRGFVGAVKPNRKAVVFWPSFLKCSIMPPKIPL
jgi:hypothetical protein